jgi:hypothetical protein
VPRLSDRTQFLSSIPDPEGFPCLTSLTPLLER